MKYIFFVSLIIFIIVVIILVMWNYISWKCKKSSKNYKQLENLEIIGNDKKISLHIILLKEDFELYFKEIEAIINLSDLYYKNIDIYLHSNDKFIITNNILSDTYNHNYRNGKIVKIIHDLENNIENSVENIRSRTLNMIKRHQKMYDIIVSVTKKDFENLKKILLQNNYGKLEKIRLK